MIDINKLAMVIANLPLHDVDRQAMLKLIPRMPMRQLKVLYQMLRAEARAWKAEGAEA